MPTALRTPLLNVLMLALACSLSCQTNEKSENPPSQRGDAAANQQKGSADSGKASGDSKELLGDPKPAAGAVIKPRINHAAIDKAGLRLGVQAYTFRAMSVYETIDTLKYLGIQYIELYPGQRLSKDNNKPVNHDMAPELTSELLQKLREANVKAVNYGVVPLVKDEAQSRKVFEWAKKMGLETIVSEPAPEKETFDTIEKLAEEFQINVAIHEHAYPNAWWYPQRILEITKGRETKRIGACADTGHWYRSGLIASECVEKLKGKVISLHLKDLNKQKQDVVWGTGMINGKEVMAEVLRHKYTHKPIFSIEFESSHGTELTNNVAKCAESFSRYCEELTK